MMIAIDKIHWLGHASFFIEGLTVKVYIDPYQIKQGLPKADIVLITHQHFDHCSADDVRKIYKSDTVIIGPKSVVRALPLTAKTIKPKEILQVRGITVEAVYAYNIKKSFHPKSEDNLGYIVDVDDTRIYHAGDTDYIPEMKDIKADICLFPIGGTYTMDAKEACQAADAINPKFVIPMHWGSIVGSSKDAEEFKKNCKPEVKILGKE
ncbi:MAG: MBL fold metallo-hydrolase [Candidatus Omnitrophica bacterium]|nr:MBL fold metallo-hydrolase [Candidatus Omnitrophota bacterium]